MNTYLILGASEFTYEGNTTEEQSDGITVVVRDKLEGCYIYLQDVNTSELFKLIITEGVVQVNTPESKFTSYRYDYYAYWKLEECDYAFFLNEVEYVSRQESFITLPKTQEELPNISHELFSVSYEVHNPKRPCEDEYKEGEYILYEAKWERIKWEL